MRRRAIAHGQEDLLQQRLLMSLHVLGGVPAGRPPALQNCLGAGMCVWRAGATSKSDCKKA